MKNGCDCCNNDNFSIKKSKSEDQIIEDYLGKKSAKSI